MEDVAAIVLEVVGMGQGSGLGCREHEDELVGLELRKDRGEDVLDPVQQQKLGAQLGRVVFNLQPLEGHLEVHCCRYILCQGFFDGPQQRMEVHDQGAPQSILHPLQSV